MEGLFRRPQAGKRLVCTLLTAWLLAVAAFLCLAAPGTEAYYVLLPLWQFLLLAAMLAALVWLLPGENTPHWCSLFAALAACVAAVRQDNGIAVAVAGCCAFALLLLWVGVPPASPLAAARPRVWLWLVVGGMVAAFTVVVGSVCVLKHRAYLTPGYDFGIFAQMYEYMRTTGLPLSTCERDGLLSHFAVHFSPIFYVLLPFYALLPRPETLLVLQCLVTALGTVPLVHIALRRGLSRRVAGLFAAVYLLYPCFLGGSLWYLHENNFLAPLLLCLLWAVECRRPLPAVLLALAVCAVKEDAPVYVAAVALYCLLTKEHRRLGAGLLLLSLAWFAAAIGLLAAFGDGVMTDRYANYRNAGEGLLAAVRAAVQDPLYVLAECFDRSKWQYILQTLLPLGLLPLLTRRPARWVLWMPYVLVNLMTDYGYQHHVGYQYGFGSGALLLYLAVLNYADLPARRRRPLPLLAAGCALIVCTAAFGRQMAVYSDYHAPANVAERQQMDAALEKIPEDASVTASCFLVSHLSRCRELYEQGYTQRQTAYVALDLRFPEGRTALEALSDTEYETVVQQEGVIAILRRR